MIVAHVLLLVHWPAWISGLTVAGVGAFVTWLWTLRKINTEIKKNQAEIAAIKAKTAVMDHRDAVRTAAMTLFRHAGDLLTVTNVAVLPRQEWAALLSDPAIVDEALRELGAERIAGKDDDWEIKLSRTPKERPWRDR